MKHTTVTYLAMKTVVSMLTCTHWTHQLQSLWVRYLSAVAIRTHSKCCFDVRIAGRDLLTGCRAVGDFFNLQTLDTCNLCFCECLTAATAEVAGGITGKEAP
jgi:hypothetical protein